MTEAAYQRKLIKKIQALLPGCVVIKNDPATNQGIPDLLILFNDRWSMLEVKISLRAPERPNQSYYIETLNGMSFASFICPENEGEVLDALQSALGVGREARLS